ncbi:MAG: KTSC domain-containing protein [Cyclobacteriaceae bacterium]|nr:KTSC domain-containing protein [Cyclobacteriaceae bacterium]
MKKAILFLSLIFAGLYLSAEDKDCPPNKENWNSEKDAIAAIETAVFEHKETADIGSESWINTIAYYSCDMEYGYLIVKCDKKSYIHHNVPVGVWTALKEAKSKGGYYNFYIKNKFKLQGKAQRDAA